MREFYTVLSVIVLIIVMIFLAIGPQGCNRKLQSWKASSYGSDWLVVQYSQNGDVINYWELRNKSVGNEQNSDGIYFIDSDDNVVHLSGHYTYVQVVNMEEAKKRYLKEPKSEIK